MSNLPVIVSLGGINAAGRSSGFHSYKRMVHDVLHDQDMLSTWHDLAQRMQVHKMKNGLTHDHLQAVLEGTCVREVLLAGDVTAEYARWMQMQGARRISHAALLPKGFDIASLYASRHHPRGLQMAVFAASDALTSLGFSWQSACASLTLDQVSVYASSALGQFGRQAIGGLAHQIQQGKKASSKMLHFALADMPVNFINSYILHHIGPSAAHLGACATFLYNLQRAVDAIQSGRSHLCLVATAEAPVEPEIVAGFSAMSAIADDSQLQALDGMATDYQRATRPFSSNAGFSIGESAQCIVLLSDTLALATGAKILGSVPGVFTHADGAKKSISSPGAGNYITMMKAASLAHHVLDGQLDKTYVHAHGSGTPQNRVTESHILNEVARTFAVKGWDVTAIKSYLGHTLASAAGDQLACALGAWQYGWIPGIHSIDHIADDVHTSHLQILQQAKPLQAQQQGVLINAKGFGGHNASALVLSPEKTKAMLTQKHGQRSMTNYAHAHAPVADRIAAADTLACQGQAPVFYDASQTVLTGEDLQLSTTHIEIPKLQQSIRLPDASHLKAYLKER